MYIVYNLMIYRNEHNNIVVTIIYVYIALYYI